MAKKTFLPPKPLQSKYFYLTLSFFVTPAVTYFVMSGGFTVYTLAFCIITAIFAAWLVILCVNDRKNIKGAVTTVIILAAAFTTAVFSYNTGYRNTQQLSYSAGTTSHVFSGFVTKEDADTSGNGFVKLISIDGKSISPPVTATFFNHSGYYLKQGTYLEFEAKLRLGNDSDSKLVGWLKSNGIHANLSGVNKIKLDSAKDTPSAASAVKGFFAERMLKVLSVIPDKDKFEQAFSISNAMMFGDKGALDSELKEQFSRSGIIHILCVSGLHFSVVLGGLSFVLKYTVKRRNIRSLFIFGAAIIYLLLCGFTRSALRAAVMSLVGAVCISGAKRNYCTYALLISVCVICIADPDSVFDSGFMMSCICCTGILCFSALSETLCKRLRYHPVISCVLSSFLVSLSASAFLFPYSLSAFGGASVVSVIASALAVIPAQLFLILCWIAAFASLAEISFLNVVFSSLLSGLCRFICAVARFFSELKYSYIEYEAPDISFLIFMLIIGCAAIVSGSKRRALSVYLYTVSASVLFSAIFLVAGAV